MRVEIRALAPLAHGTFGEASTGNIQLLRREPIVSLPGRPMVPCLSGNTLRGKVRRILMRGLLAAGGLTREGEVAAGRAREWDRLYGCLVNGGTIEKPDQRVKPDAIRALRSSLPPLSVLGAAIYRGTIAGRCRFGWCWPVCVETVEAGLVVAPPGVELVDAESLVTESTTVRLPDTEAHDIGISRVKPMPHGREAIATGALIVCDILFEAAATDVEMSAISWALTGIESIGGSSAQGYGDVRVRHDGDMGTAYMAWLEAQVDLGERLRAFADSLG